MMHEFPAGAVIENKYLKWYLRLCATPSGSDYVERHHIVPRSFGGTDVESNIVALSARSHFLAHVLLIRCATGRYRRSAALAAHYMLTGCNQQRYGAGTSRTYEAVRRAAVEAHRGREVSVVTRDKLSRLHRGKKISPEAKVKMSKALRKARPFYILINGAYTREQDFYRYCDLHGLGRSQIQKGLTSNEVHVVLAGKHKGKCFSWEDVGAERMETCRLSALGVTRERRQEATSRQWEQAPKRAGRAIEVVLWDTEGIRHRFATMLEAEKGTGIPWTTLQSCSQKLPWTFIHGKGKGWTLISKNRR